MSKFSEYVFLLFQHTAPKHLITKAVGVLADKQLGWFTTFVIKRFIRHYGVNMEIAEKSNPSDYETFNSFFTRALKQDARAIDSSDGSLVFPVDGTVSRLGKIESGRIIQAKGFDYSINTLLGGDRKDSDTLRDGSFITIYLSPKDYHRVHIPCAGKLKKMIFIPGKLYSVNPLTVSHINDIFARNERVVCVFETDFGDMYMVLVGATVVGSMETVWAGTVKEKTIETWDYSDRNITFKKGDEIGRFKLGSTVICCFPKNTVEFDKEIKPFSSTMMGIYMGTVTKSIE